MGKRYYKNDKKGANDKTSSSSGFKKTPLQERKVAEVKVASLLKAAFTTMPIGVNGINAILQQPGSSLDYLFTKKSIYIDISETILKSTAYDLVKDQITAVLAAYGASRGLAVTVTEQNIYDYLVAAADAYATFLCLYRIQNAQNVTTATGLDISLLFEDRVYLNTTPTASVVTTAVVANTAVTHITDLTSINNAVWAQTYLSKLHYLRLPDALIRELTVLFSGYFVQNEGKYPCLVEFLPNGLNGSVFSATVFTNTYIAACAALINANPDLTNILTMLGFSADPIMSMDWNRDLTGQSVLMVSDPYLNDLYVNGWVDAFAQTEVTSNTDIQYSLRLHNSEQSVFSFDPNVLVDLNDYSFGLLCGIRFQDAYADVRSMFAIQYIDEVGAHGYLYTMFPADITLVGDGGGSIAGVAQAASRLSAAAQRYVSLVGAPSPMFRLAVTVTLDSANAVYSTAVSVGATLEGPNKVVLPSDISSLIDIMRLNGIFGSQYRKTLQLLLSSFPKKNNTAQL